MDKISLEKLKSFVTKKIRQNYPFASIRNLRIVRQNMEKKRVVSSKDKVIRAKKKSVFSAIQHAVGQIAEGGKELGRDVKLYFHIKMKPYEDRTIIELRATRRIFNDMIKFVPFSIFAIVPFLELCLPVYLVMFPNAMPNQFLFESAMGEKVHRMNENHNSGAEALQISINMLLIEMNVSMIKFLNLRKNLSDFLDHSDKKKEEIRSLIEEIDSELIAFIYRFGKINDPFLLNLSYLSSDELLQVCKLLHFEFFPGTNIINQLWYFAFNFPAIFLNTYYKLRKMKKRVELTNPISKFKFEFNTGVFEPIKKKLLTFQIMNHMRHIRSQDLALQRNIDVLETAPRHELAEIAMQRGLTINGMTLTKNYLKKFWLPLSTNPEISNDILIWSSIFRRCYIEDLVFTKQTHNK